MLKQDQTHKAPSFTKHLPAQSIFLEPELLPLFCISEKTYGKPIGSLVPEEDISVLLIHPNKAFAVLCVCWKEEEEQVAGGKLIASDIQAPAC